MLPLTYRLTWGLSSQNGQPSLYQYLLDLKQVFPKLVVKSTVYAMYSWFSHDITKVQTKKSIDSSKFLLSWGITTPTHLYLIKFSVQTSSSFWDRGRLNFQAFAWCGIQLVAEKALIWVKNVKTLLNQN